jgi:two-component system alkaline phosphatase synthesis response regulator PhoP
MSQTLDSTRNGTSREEYKARILLAEDEEHIAFVLKLNLEQEGYQVIHVPSGDKALMALHSEGPFEVLILDVMMPGVNGIQVAKIARHNDPKVGIIILTAVGSPETRMEGLASGVDDYLTKPFLMEELILRIRRAIDRAKFFQKSDDKSGAIPAPGKKTLSCGDFSLDCDRLLLSGPKGNFHLTALEADVLNEFFSHPGEVLTREYLLTKVWQVSGLAETRTVDNFMVRLRRYLEPHPKEPQHLLSIRGRGYQFQP